MEVRSSEYRTPKMGLETLTGRVGKRGTFVLPARLRKQFGLQEGSLVIAEARDDGILIRPAVAIPIEVYTPERIAEFLLTNAVDEDDYAAAMEDVRQIGLNPAGVNHERPTVS